MKVSVEKITPMLAESLLKLNTDNRKLRTSHVDFLAAQMRSGNFRLTHQGIAISEDDVLLDGQHRLRAVVKSGVAVDMYVFRDVDGGTFTAIDIGAKRSNSDVTKIPRGVVSLVEVVSRIKKGDKWFRAFDKTSPDETIAIYEQQKDTFDFFGKQKKKSVIFLAGAMIAYLKTKNEEIKDQAVKFAYNEYHVMKPSMLVLCKKHDNKVLKSGSSSDRATSLAHAFRHFLPENMNKQIIRVDFDKTFDQIKSIVDENFK